MSLQPVIGKTVDFTPGVRTYIGQLDGTPNFDRPSLLPRGEERKVAVATELRRINANAMSKAAPSLDALKGAGLIQGYEVNPLTNTVIVHVPEDKASAAWNEVRKVEGMGKVRRNREIRLEPVASAAAGAAAVQAPPAQPPTQPVPPTDPPKQPTKTHEWNVTKVGAPDVWAQGFTGQGVTVGVIDTGIDVKHPALAAKYRGTAADGTMDHNHNWFDAVNGRKAAYDDNEHGTHVSGTIAGSTKDAEGNERFIGMAPDAKLIGSKILSASGSGSLAGVTKGLEWMLAPTDVDGNNPDPSKAPDIVSNSWGTNDGTLDVFRNVTAAFNAAGIVPVFAAGNSGPGKGTVGSPGSYPDVISVGATDKNDVIASFSSRGPSPMPGDDGNDQKPDISFPGKDIVSSVPGGGYDSFSGTSMATPGVSGVIALMLSKHRDLSNDEVRQALHQGVVDLGTPGYDYDYGHGRLDAVKALAAADALVAGRPPVDPPTDPGTPPTDPGTPPTDPGTPPTDPGTPPTDPGAPTNPPAQR